MGGLYSGRLEAYLASALDEAPLPPFRPFNSPTPRAFCDLATPFLNKTGHCTIRGRQRLESAERQPAITEADEYRFVQAQQFALLGRIAHGLQREHRVAGTGHAHVRELQDAMPRRLGILVGRTQALATTAAEIDIGAHEIY